MSARMISKVAATLVFLACAGCGPRTSDAGQQAIEPVVYRDSVTGCEYLTTGQYHALTPRMSADGKQICKAVHP
jgi:hypothetical protein